MNADPFSELPAHYWQGIRLLVAEHLQDGFLREQLLFFTAGGELIERRLLEMGGADPDDRTLCATMDQQEMPATGAWFIAIRCAGEHGKGRALFCQNRQILLLNLEEHGYQIIPSDSKITPLSPEQRKLLQDIIDGKKD